MKTILLTQGKTTIVDDEDYEWLSSWKWHFGGRGYAVRFAKGADGKQHIIFMHREINKTPHGFYTDHINLDRLDNRKNNLRICSPLVSACNRGKQCNNTSGYIGVIWNPVSHCWRAKIQTNKKWKSLGQYSDPIEAAHAYDEAAKKYHGEFARTNF